MGLFLTKDMSSAYVGEANVKEIYLGGTKIWPLGLPSGTTFKFDYTGDVQSVYLPAGRYKLQCWGAQGGNVTGSYAVSGSKGGYSEGILNLTESKTLYIFVGGQGTSYTSSASQTSTTVLNGGWNGGGTGLRTAYWNDDDIEGRSFPRAGGGATDIALVTSSMSYSSGRTNRSSESLLSRFIVAGGGAGASARYTIETESYYETITDGYNSGSLIESANGNANGYCYGRCEAYLTAGVTYYADWETDAPIWNNSISWWKSGAQVGYGNSFTPSSSGTYALNVFFKVAYIGEPYSMSIYHEEIYSDSSTSSGKSSGAQQGGGTSGKGQYPGTQSSAGSGGAFGLGASQSSTNYRYCGGGGGGGWYGGGTNKSDTSTSYVNYSGGGSGFVNTAANASYRPSGYTGLQLESGTTTAGNSSHPSISGGTETGHNGHGYAIITVL